MFLQRQVTQFLVQSEVSAIKTRLMLSEHHSGKTPKKDLKKKKVSE
jgi:hypothetical protein